MGFIDSLVEYRTKTNSVIAAIRENTLSLEPEQVFEKFVKEEVQHWFEDEVELLA